MDVARVVARRSLCTRDKVGAVVIDTYGKIIGSGYNNPPRNFQHGDRPCTTWCARARPQPTAGYTGANIPGELEIHSWGIVHKLHGEEKHIEDYDAFMRAHGGKPVPAERAVDYSDCPSLHAEANALMMSDRSLRLHGTIYVTSAICMTCAKLIANSGLTDVVVDLTDVPKHRNWETVATFLESCLITVYALGASHR